MSLVLPSGQLRSRVLACGLLSGEQWNLCARAMPGEEPADESTVAEQAVRQGLLTQWQLDQVRAGRLTFLLDNGRYLLLRELGRGGMGVVYLALHRRLQRHFAVKVLPASVTADPQHVARFVREMELIGKLTDPHIVQATDAGEIDGQHYLVMEYVDGGTLSDVLRATGPLGIADACEAIRQAALGLQHISDCRLVHRDLKPSNLMLARDGKVKLADLGLALLSYQASPGNASAEPLTLDGQIMGTLDYMAPEQLGNAHRVDIRADIYSLGCALHALLTGAAPFTGPEFPTIYEKIEAHKTCSPPDVSKQRPDVPAGLSHLVRRMVAKSPDGRPQSPRELAEEIASFTATHNLRRLAETAFAARLPRASGTKSTFAPISSAQTGTIVPLSSGEFANSATPTAIASPQTPATDSSTSKSPSAPPQILDREEPARARLSPAARRRRPPLRLWGPIVLALSIVAAWMYVARPSRVAFGEMRFDLNVPTTSVQFSVDGEPVDANALDGFVRLTAGRHRLLVSAPGHTPLETSFDVQADVRDALPLHLVPRVIAKIAPEGRLESVSQVDDPFAAIAVSESRVVAPGSENAPSLIDEDFRVSKRMLVKATKDVNLRHEADRYSVSVRPTWSFNAPCPGGAVASPACRVVGRASNGTGAWFVDLYRHYAAPQSKTMAIRISLEAGPQLRVDRAHFQTEAGRGPRLSPIQHPAIRPVDQWNELFAIVRDGKLELYVNGIAVCAPVEIDPDNVPAEMAIGAQATPTDLETAEFLSFQSWNATDLSRPDVRKISPFLPDLSGASVLLDREFDTAAEFSTSDEIDWRRSYESGHYVIRTRGARSDFVGNTTLRYRNFAVEVVGRLRGEEGDGWGITVYDPAMKSANAMKGLTLTLSPSSGEFQVRSSHWDKNPKPARHLGRFRHPAIRRGEEFNSLMLLVRGNVVQAFVNSVPVASPIILEAPLDPAEIQLTALDRGNGVWAEFDSLKVWSLEKVPPPFVPIGQWATPVPRTQSPIVAGRFAAAPHDVIPKFDAKPTAIDLSGIKPFLVDELDAASSGFPPISRWPGIDIRYRDGRWVLSSDGSGSFTWFNTWKLDDFVVEVSARNRGTGFEPHVLRNQWSLVIQQAGEGSGKRSFQVGINRSGQWNVRPWAEDSEKATAPYLGLTSHPAIRPGSESNAVRLSVHKRIVRIHINGVEVCHPFELAYEPGRLQVGLAIENERRGETEFERIAVWPGEIEPLTPGAPRNGVQYDALKERAAAELVLKSEGTVEVLDGNARRVVMRPAELPEIPFRLTAINLPYSRSVTDSALTQFNGLSSLEWLNLEGCPVTGAGFSNVEGLDSLDWLLLHQCPLSDDGLVAIAKFQTVTHLGLTGSQITDRGLRPLKKMSSLRALGLGRTSVTDKEILSIAEIPSLVELYMESTAITGATLDALAACPLLEKLHLFDARVAAEQAHRLAALTNLRMLGADKTLLTGASLKSVGQLGKLEFLGLGRLPIESDDLKFLRDCKELRELHLWQTRVTDDGLLHLAPFVHLRSLGLNETKITDAGLMRIAELASLRELEAKELGLPEEAWNRLKARRPQLVLRR